MTIRDLKKFNAQLWDWGILDGCFGNTRIAPSDLDGYIERNGHFLVIEGKSHNAPLKGGQARAFKSMIQTGYFVVLVVWGEANKPEKMQLFPSEIKPATLDDLRRVVSWWYRHADTGANPAMLLAARMTERKR